MKKVSLSIAMIIIAINIFAQLPQAFKYQAVVRDNAGNVLANQNVSFKIIIVYQGSPSYAVYLETHVVLTNQFGLVNLEIGNGTAIYGEYMNINWGDGLYNMQIEMDESGGNNYQLLGTAQLLPVPYSVYSGLSGGLLLKDKKGNSYSIGIDTLGNLTTTLVYKWEACGDTLVDSRDGQKYTTVSIGSQCWMAKNLNFGIRIDGVNPQSDNSIIEKYCYNDLQSNCDSYGGLYQWDEVMQYLTTGGVQGICPSEWHIPTDEEWKQLEGEVDSFYGYPDPEWDKTLFRGVDAGLNLKSVSGWADDGNGTDLYGFTALSGGHRFPTTDFYGLGFYATFWSSTQNFSGEQAWYRRLRSIEGRINRFYDTKDHGFSVRCLKD